MRNISTLAFALAASLSFSGLAHADEYLSASNKEFYAVAAQSAAEAAKPATASLGYAASSDRAQQINTIFAAPSRSADQLDLKLGDRGLGNN